MEERKYCVYKHTNKHNGKVYIGITSQRPSKRWDCGRGYQKNKHFWNAIQKYGWYSFEHEILFSGLRSDEAFAKERELIQEYDSRNYNKGYNLSSGGEGGATGISGEKHPMWGKHHTEETRKKMSQSRKGVPFSPERLAAHRERLDRKVLSERAKRVLAGYNKGRRPSDETIRKLSISNTGKKRSEETKRKIGEGHSIPVVQLSCDGSFLKIWKNAKTAAQTLSIQAGHISKVCKGQRKTAGGYVWVYANKYNND